MTNGDVAGFEMVLENSLAAYRMTDDERADLALLLASHAATELDQARAALERAHITLRETLEVLEYPTEDGSERAALGVRVVLGMCLTKGCSEQAAGEGEWCPSCGFEGPDEDESPATQPPPTTAHTGEG